MKTSFSSPNKFLILASFKSNKLSHEVKSWLNQVAPIASQSSAEIVLAPSFLHLPLVLPNHGISLASQDVSPFPPGSYTGAINSTQLKDLKVKYSLVGHSERRRYFHETSHEVANKIRELISSNITPIVCLRKEDIQSQISILNSVEITSSLFVYEPPADIGGTEIASLSDIKTTCSLITNLTQQPTLYGGSVNAGNLDKLLSLNLAGVLVSTASLKANNFIDLINRYDSYKG